MEETAAVSYSSAVDSLIYAMVCISQDIAQVISVVSRFLLNPGKDHLEGVKWILKYLKSTSKMAWCFG